MTRTFSLLSMIAALGIGGYLFTAQAGQRATSTQETEAIEQAGEAAASATFAQAAVSLEAQHAETGSYAGTDLSGAGGVVLVRADATTYCIQTAGGTAISHRPGPGAATVPGPC